MTSMVITAGLRRQHARIHGAYSINGTHVFTNTVIVNFTC